MKILFWTCSKLTTYFGPVKNNINRSKFIFFTEGRKRHSNFETFQFLKSCPIFDELSLIAFTKSNNFPRLSFTFDNICSSTATASATSSEAEQMRPPPPPHELHERRRSNSASPSDKLLLKRAASYAGLSGLGAAAGSLTTNCPSPLAGRPKSSTLGKAL